MKNWINVLICLLFSVSLISQKTISENKTWYEFEWNQFGPSGSTSLYSFRKDTIIDSIEYLELFKSNDTLSTSGWSSTFTHLREDSLNRVYIRRFEKENILYDFNLVENDTFIFDDDGMYCELLVYEVDSIQLLNGEYRKRIRLTRADFPQPGVEFIDWIQGIGSTNSLLDYWGKCYIDITLYLTCFYENGELVYSRDSIPTCFKTPIEEYKEGLQVKIFPNPSESIITIESDLMDIVIHLYSMEGELLLKTDQRQIDVSNFEPGIYLISLYYKSELHVEKLIIQ